MVSCPFAKYRGCGNDFILVDNRTLFFPIDPAFIASKCSRSEGIGSDGLILLEPSSIADFKMRYFNADGSEAEMCGNGIRCLGKFIHELQIEGERFLIETSDRKVGIDIGNDLIAVHMGAVKDCRWSIPIEIEGQEQRIHYLNTGVPHAILFIDEIKEAPIETVAPFLRHHPLFAPKGANINFCSYQEDKLSVRTYERGVEGETLACGTGACASALAASRIYSLSSPITVIPRSDEKLTVHFDSSFGEVILTGPAEKEFSGAFELSLNPSGKIL